MAKICPVCNQDIGFWKVNLGDVIVHPKCESTFIQDPEKYDPANKTEDLWIRKLKEQEEKAVYKSVQIKGGVNINNFDMPFGDMVGFMVKWALASIPAFIILAIIGAIFFAIFTAIFVSTR